MRRPGSAATSAITSGRPRPAAHRPGMRARRRVRVSGWRQCQASCETSILSPGYATRPMRTPASAGGRRGATRCTCAATTWQRSPARCRARRLPPGGKLLRQARDIAVAMNAHASAVVLDRAATRLELDDGPRCRAGRVLVFVGRIRKQGSDEDGGRTDGRDGAHRGTVRWRLSLQRPERRHPGLAPDETANGGGALLGAARPVSMTRS